MVSAADPAVAAGSRAGDPHRHHPHRRPRLRAGDRGARRSAMARLALSHGRHRGGPRILQAGELRGHPRLAHLDRPALEDRHGRPAPHGGDRVLQPRSSRCRARLCPAGDPLGLRRAARRRRLGGGLPGRGHGLRRGGAAPRHRQDRHPVHQLPDQEPLSGHAGQSRAVLFILVPPQPVVRVPK